MLNYKVAHVFDKTEPIQYNKRVFPIKRYNCPCGGIFTVITKDKHKITKQHRYYINKRNAIKINIKIE